MKDRATIVPLKCHPPDAMLMAANTGAPNSLTEELERMARKRYQHGSVILRGVTWTGIYREDEILPDGTVHRPQRWETLGTLKDYPTKRLAQRALDQKLAEINSLTYKPRPTATFQQFAERWQKDVLSQHKRSTQSADKSRLNKHILPEFRGYCMKDINREVMQAFVGRKSKTLSPKSVRNLVLLLREMWMQARADGYSNVDPFFALVLPERGLTNERFLTLEEMQKVIETAPEPYKTYYWILAETGIRCGEACGLPTRNLLLDLGAIKVTQKVWGGKIETVKSLKGNRMFEISPQLVEHLRAYLRSWRPNKLDLLFATENGTPWDADTVRKRRLYPLLQQLGIERCGFHAFRHGNETVMDGEGVPMATRQNRLGHSDARTTMKYTHVISEDGRKIASRFGELLAPSAPVPTMPVGNA
jgi:integrase